MQPARWLVLAIALVTVEFAACGDRGASEVSTSPADRLEAAIEKTLAVESMVISSSGAADESDHEAADSTDTGSVTEYLAPDRARTRLGAALEVRIIANVTYMPAMDGPGWWSRTATPGRPIGPLMELHVLRNHDEVTDDGDQLSVTLRGDQGTAVVELRDGYVVRIDHTFIGGSYPATIVVRFSKFNEPVDPIEAPPAEDVREQPDGDAPKESQAAALT